MASATGFAQHVSSFISFRWLLIIGALLLVCCTCIDSKPTEVEQVSEQHQPVDSDYPYLLFADESNMFERAAPRLGRASPRLGRASPRLGRRTSALFLSHLNHAADDDTNELDSWLHERRAAPRLGRSIHVHQQGKQA